MCQVRAMVAITCSVCWAGLGAPLKLAGPDFVGSYRAIPGGRCDGAAYEVAWDAEELQLDVTIEANGKKSLLVVDTVPRAHYHYPRDRNGLSIERILGADKRAKRTVGSLTYVSETTRVAFDKSGTGSEMDTQREEIGLSRDGRTLTHSLFRNGNLESRCKLAREVASASSGSHQNGCGL